MQKINLLKNFAPKGIPLDVINMQDYGMMNGAKSIGTKQNH